MNFIDKKLETMKALACSESQTWIVASVEKLNLIKEKSTYRKMAQVLQESTLWVKVKHTEATSAKSSKSNLYN